MSNEHNPIAQLITRIQQTWLEEVTSDTKCKLIRVLISPDETKLYQGFLQIESSPHGRLPELFIVFLTPFHSKDSFSLDIIKSWFEAYDQDDKTIDKFRKENPGYAWDYDYFKTKISQREVDADKLLLEMLSSFYSAIRMPGKKLLLTLMPYIVNNIKGYEQWLKSISNKGIPENVQICIFDYVEQKYFDKLFDQDISHGKTIRIKLNLDEAINQLIEAGDPKLPEVQLRKCMLKMADASKTKNLEKFNHWGNHCIALMTGSKIKSLMATAYLIYGSMLFNFKIYEEIEKILQKGLKIAEAGSASGDSACKNLIPLFYGYIASNYQLSKRNRLAIEWFCKQASLHEQNAFPVQAITAYWQAAYLAKEHEALKYESILVSAYNLGSNLKKEEAEFSQYCYIGLDYYHLLISKGKIDLSEEVNIRLSDVYGKDWKESTKQKVKSLHTKYSTNPETVYAGSK